MTQKDINIALTGFLGVLFGATVSLCIYIYMDDKDTMVQHVVEDTASESEQNKKMEELNAAITASQLALLDKIYNISLTSSNNIKDLQINAAKSEGNYNTLNQKVDNLITSSKEDRQLYMSKFDEYEKRIGQLEKNDSIQDKNIGIIAKDRGIRLFSATW